MGHTAVILPHSIEAQVESKRSAWASLGYIKPNLETKQQTKTNEINYK